MLAVRYKKMEANGVTYLPCRSKSEAIKKAERLYKNGMTKVGVVEIKEKELYCPS